MWFAGLQARAEDAGLPATCFCAAELRPCLLTDLLHLPHSPITQACEPVLKTLLSAAANAKQNLGLKKAKLVVSECYANEGPVLKRAQPRAQVRLATLCQWLAHILL